jgi:TBC1 domain family member 8/9
MAFWTLCQIIEQLLPLDNYINLIGVLVDQKVLEQLIKEHLPRLSDFLDERPEVQKLFRWIMVIFVGTLPYETELQVWDLFFTKDSTEIFRIALNLLQML